MRNTSGKERVETEGNEESLEMVDEEKDKYGGCMHFNKSLVT
jgi:hypothetical protein